MFEKSTKKGFSLVEILVVIAVIGLLTSIIFFSIQKVRAVARDNQRIANLEQMKLALRLYKDKYGRYPNTCADSKWNGPGPGTATWYEQCSIYAINLAPNFIPTLPQDPISENDPDNGFLYTVNTAGSEYKLLVHATVETNIVYKGEPYARCPASCSESHCSQNTYAIYSPGAACW